MNILGVIMDFLTGHHKTTPPPSYPALVKPNIAVINESTVLSDVEILLYVNAQQIQLDRDFGPIWGSTANLVILSKGSQIPPGYWELHFLDNSDQAGALGYHEVNNQGYPLLKCFAKTDLDNGASWTVTASHEVMETLADPSINVCMEVDDNQGNATFWAREVGDPVEADSLGYKINNQLMSDFVFPDYWGNLAGSRYDFGNHIAEPLQILPEGYAAVYTPGSGWGTLGKKANQAPDPDDVRNRIPKRQNK
jgi:hypothetical protein